MLCLYALLVSQGMRDACVFFFSGTLNAHDVLVLNDMLMCWSSCAHVVSSSLRPQPQLNHGMLMLVRHAS
jgi:hypothetical protein